jgi:hypothetical protein
VPDGTHTLTALAGENKELALDLRLAPGAKPGRHVIELRDGVARRGRLFRADGLSP